MSVDEQSDEALMALIRSREVDALEVLYDRYRVLAYSLALRLLSNPMDAEDVVQESFVNVWRSAETYDLRRNNVRSWILSVVHHRAIDKLRGRQSRIQPVVLEEGMSVADGKDVWQEVQNNLTGQDVREALDQLPMEQRETIELAYFKGYTHSQIAEMTKVPLGTVKGRMRIGLHKLKSLLASSQTEMVTE